LQLLQLSGVGSPSLLKERGIEVAASVPGVGENLHDHFGVMMAYRLLPHVQSINERSHGVRFLGELLRYAVQRRGLLTLTAGSVAAFGKSRPDVATADIQYHIMAASYKIHRSNKTQPSINPKSKRKPRSFYRRPLEREPGLTFAAYLMRPASRGSVRISSSDPMVAPAITPNYLAERSDQLATVQALRGIKTIISQSALKPYISHPTVPDASYETDDDLLRHARSTGAPAYHPVGTCRMGSDDASVVDPKLRVRGVAGLRVVDASIMPRIASGNTNAPTIMIAEKAADMILGR